MIKLPKTDRLALGPLSRSTAFARRMSACLLCRLVILALCAIPTLQPARASDHADPTNLVYPETNITDLFFYPEGDHMVLIFNIRRALLKPPPYNLKPFSFDVHFDLTTPVSFDDAANRARYGGTVLLPAKLHDDASVSLRLNDDLTVKSATFTVMSKPQPFKSELAVRDDPFNFPRFYAKNAITMIMNLPRSAFPAGQQDFILWASTSKDGALIDHVGRSIRTQLPRFGFLNTVPPKDQLAAIVTQKARLDNVYNFFRNKREWWSVAIADLLQFTVQLRPYDLQPDVMIYTDRFPAGYPNGRLINDDVVAQTCAFGDCLLQELSFIEGGFPRSTVNDKPFLPQWPYEAAPWPAQKEAPLQTASIWPYVIALVLAIGLFFWIVGEVVRFLLRKAWRAWTRLILGHA